MKYKLLIIIVLMISPPSLAIDYGYARIVTTVRGLQDYDLHWNDRFPPGSVLKIYAEANGVNHKRAVAIDYIFIIRDPNNYIVDTASYYNRYEDYRENDFITYQKRIPETWVEGVYTAEIHIFDLLNDSLMDTYHEKLYSSYINNTDKPDIPVMNRSQASAQGQEIIIRKTFFIDRYASKYPPDRFRVENIMLEKTTVAPREPLKVMVNVTNTFDEAGSTTLSLLMDGVPIETTTVEVNPHSSKRVVFVVSSEVVGEHELEILPVGENTIGLNLYTTFNVVRKEIQIPTTFDFKDIQIDKLSVAPNIPVMISVTIKNQGKAGSQKVKLYVNNVLEEEREVYLNFSETRVIRFNITKKEVGAYKVRVEKLSKIFFVELPSLTPVVTPTSEIEKKKKPLDILLVLSILIIIIYILRKYRIK